VTDNPGIWVYAIAGGGDGTGLTPPGVAGVAGADVRPAPVTGLTAVVSDVDLAEFGEGRAALQT